MNERSPFLNVSDESAFPMTAGDYPYENWFPMCEVCGYIYPHGWTCPNCDKDDDKK